MNSKSKLVYILIGTIFFALFAACWFLYISPRYSVLEYSTVPQVIVLIVAYVLFLILIVFNKVRGRLYDFFTRLVDKSSGKTLALFFFSFILSIFLLNYFVFSSKLDDNVLPASLKFNIIELSAFLGGLVLATIAIAKPRNDLKKDLISISRFLILSTISFIFFAILAYNANIPINTLTTFKNIVSFVDVLLFYTGSVCFFMGIIKLIIMLFRFNHYL